MNKIINKKNNIRDLYAKEIPEGNHKKKRITGKAGKDFSIIKINEYSKLLECEYRVNQLKDMCKHYKLKISGNKKDLIARIYNFLLFTNASNVIQRRWRIFLCKKYMKCHGPALNNKMLCVNDTDFLSMENINKISLQQFYSFKDEDGMIYGFDVKSLYNLILKQGNDTRNPYNRKPFPKNVKRDINNLIKIGNIINLKTDVNIEVDKITQKKQNELKIIELFQEIDNLGNYTNAEWFLDLSRLHLIRYIRELSDIWNYRADLPFIIKREICPPIGNPFMGCNINTLPTKNLEELRDISQLIITRMIKTGVNHGSKCLGANYVLCALTLVNNAAAIALPWLYQSVAPN